jgi:predicted dehydrogenase
MGMVGGGPGAFIGNVHRIAARLDDQIELVCGAFSSTPEKSKAQGKELFLDPNRAYGSWEEMIREEAKLPADVRMDFVSIVTPNHMHFPPAYAALEAGFHVISDKPMTLSTEEAKKLVDKVEETGLVFGLTHNYTGYPMVKQARQMVADGELGKIRRVLVEYPQGWMAEKLEDTGQKQAAWRSDPQKSGAAGAIGDIGTHAENLASYIIDQEPAQLLSETNRMVEGRILDDDASVLLRFNGGAKGLLFCSQIAVGEENALKVRVYGEKGGLEWNQMEPNSLRRTYLNDPATIMRTGVGSLSAISQTATRLPAGHPEGFLEAFANIYRGVTQAIRVHNGEDLGDAVRLDFPTVEDGYRGMLFIEKVIESSEKGNVWVEL